MERGGFPRNIREAAPRYVSQLRFHSMEQLLLY